MGLTVSYRHEGCTRTETAGRLAHMLRDVEEQQGLYRQHSNELIDPARTASNLSFRFGVDAGGEIVKERITDMQSVKDHHRDRLGVVRHFRTDKAGRTVPVAIRKDASVAVELLFQLDPAFTGPCAAMTPDKRAEIQALYEAFYRDVLDTYGPENVLAISEHWDETSPHVQAFVVPVTSENELSAKMFTTGKKKPTRAEATAAYASKHDALRDSLREMGYGATTERVTPARHVDLQTFKKAAATATKAERERLEIHEDRVQRDRASVVRRDKQNWLEYRQAAVALDARAATLDEREKQLASRRRTLDQAAAGLDARTATLDDREQRFDEREWVIDQRGSLLDKRKRRLDEREGVLDEREQRLDQREQKTAEQLEGYRQIMRWLRAETDWHLDRATARHQAAERRDRDSRRAVQFLRKHVAKLKLTSEEQATLQQVAKFVMPKGNETSPKRSADNDFGY